MTMNLGINKSKIKGNKKAILSFSLILMLALTLMMAFAQPSLAQVGVIQPEKTVGFCTVAPTLLGVGQQLTCNLWVYPLPTTYAYQPYFKGFSGVTVTFVRPDGTKDTFMPTDETGSYVAGEMQSLAALYFYYTPQMAGNWSISFNMPAQNITDSSGTVQFLGCNSNTFYFTVQTGTVLAGLLNGYPWSQLPNSNVYWSYPINANNREWYQISGDWMGMYNTISSVNSPTAVRWQPYGSGPNTAHIVWSQPLKPGGLIGGAYGSHSYASATNTVYYVNQLVTTEGKIFVNIPNTTPNGQVIGQFRCYDLSTGQVLYTANGSITNGVHVPGNTYAQASYDASVLLANSYGSDYTSYLWGSVVVNGITYWNYYDPLTGVLVRQINNASAAQLVDGTELAFGAGKPTGQTQGYIYRWNMTSVVNNNWWTGVTWKVPWPTAIANPRSIGQLIFGESQDLSTIVVYDYNQYWGYDAATGASLWNLTLNYQVNTNQELPLANVDDFIVWNPTASAWNAYSMKTGALLWTTPSVASSPWATTWTIYYAETNDLNNVYFATADGSVYAFSLADGHLLWTSTAIPSTEYTENALPTVTPGMVMVDGKIYVYAGYSLSYQLNPIPRFSEMLCINATTGDTIYTLNGGDVPGAASNGYLFASGVFDGNLYCLGKGPSSTTVMAQQQVGGSVLIQGSVLDTSPASSSATLSAMFANGVPAISDANMSVWMDYLHMQNSTLLNSPPICTGVPVTLTAVDPNGNVIVIGTPTSDYLGNYEFQWTPTTPGLYKVYATFTGSNSYYPSSASTGATVATAAATSIPAPTATSAPSNLATTTDLMTYIAVVGIAIIIAIAIGFIVLYRKK